MLLLRFGFGRVGFDGLAAAIGERLDERRAARIDELVTAGLLDPVGAAARAPHGIVSQHQDREGNDYDEDTFHRAEAETEHAIDRAQYGVAARLAEPVAKQLDRRIRDQQQDREGEHHGARRGADAGYEEVRNRGVQIMDRDEREYPRQQGQHFLHEPADEAGHGTQAD